MFFIELEKELQLRVVKKKKHSENKRYQIANRKQSKSTKQKHDVFLNLKNRTKSGGKLVGEISPGVSPV